MKKAGKKELDRLLEDIKKEAPEALDDNYLMTEDGSIPGTVESVIYRNDMNGYSVITLNSGGVPVSAVGIMPDVGEGDRLSVYGRWEQNPKFGRQFKVNEYRTELPGEAADLEKYLASGAIKGIGPKTASKIVEAFGDDTATVIGEHPDWLAQIPGITPKRAREISEEFKSKSDIRAVMAFFRSYIGPSMAMKVYGRYKERAVETAKRSPYLLCDEIEGLSFERIDVLAGALGFARDCPERLSSGVRTVLCDLAFREGHTCIPYDRLLPAAAEFLGIPAETAEEAVKKEVAAGRIVAEDLPAGDAVPPCAGPGVLTGETAVSSSGPVTAQEAGESGSGGFVSLLYPAEMYDHESYIAGRLCRLCRGSASLDIGDIETFISHSEKNQGIRYADEQRQAIFTALSRGVTVITGGPGTGKTTVISALIGIFGSMDMKLTLAAPTGRAAKRITEATGREARTIHRLLEVDMSDEGGRDMLRSFRRNEKNRLEEDVIIVDEISMIDTLLMSALLHALKPGCRLVLIGDADQLPSVGAGNILADIIASGVIPVVSLRHIFRQAESSLIVMNAHAINRGQMPVLNSRDRDFFFIEKESDRDIADYVADLCARRLPAAYGPSESVQVISPTRRGTAGTEYLNTKLQELVNPPAAGRREHRRGNTVFRTGDRVMQVRNNYDIEWRSGRRSGQGIFNGDIGVITGMDNFGKFMDVSFDGREVVYDFSSLEDLELAYAITVHKSQGSEYDSVVIPLGDIPPVLATRNLLYTAVTRAHKRVIIVGKSRLIADMVSNSRTDIRYTGLVRRLLEADSTHRRKGGRA